MWATRLERSWASSRHCGRRRHGERGLSTSVEMSLLFPAVFLTMLLILQWGLHHWASAVALASAQDGARAAAGYGSNLGVGLAAARQAIYTDALTEVEITGNRGDLTTTITVRGRALSLIPGWAPSVTKTAMVPTERITQKGR